MLSFKWWEGGFGGGGVHTCKYNYVPVCTTNIHSLTDDSYVDKT